MTPVLDGARFIRATIESVLAQDYPVEYLVVDGGSSDGTLEIVRSYGDRLRLIEGRDAGQAQALNRGFAAARGDILGWLNADDRYLPAAVTRAVEAFECLPEAAAVYGEAGFIDAQGCSIGAYPVERFSGAALARRCIVCQPAAFIRRRAFEAVGGLDESLHYAFDYDLWIRLSRVGGLEKIDATLAEARMHAESKTLGRRGASYRETMEVLSRHFGYVPFEWVYAYACYLCDREDQFFAVSKRSPGKVLLSLALGVARNPRRPLHYVRDWIAHRGVFANFQAWARR